MHKNTLLFCLFISFFLTIESVYSAIVKKIEVEEKIYSDMNRGQNIIVITGKELEKFRVRNLSSILEFLPGVSVLKRGPEDSSFDISMRGGNFEQISVQLNGSPVNNPQTGHFNTDIPIGINDIERIVVTKGIDLNSSSSGLSGTINIILKKESKLKLSVTGGEKKYFSMNISKGLKLKNFQFRFTGGKKNSTGFYKGNEFNISNFLAYTGYQSGSISANLTFGVLDKDLGAENFYAPFPSLEKINSTFSNLLIKKNLRESEIRVSYMRNVHHDNFILDRDNRSYYENSSRTEKNYLKLTGLLFRKGNRIHFGADMTDEKMDSSAMGFVRRGRAGLFLNFNRDNKKWSFNGGFRVGVFPENEIKFLYNFDFFEKINQHFSFTISVGKKIRIPNFTELFYNSPANSGNRDLKDEVVFNHQLMMSFYLKNQIFNLSFFYRKQRDLIDWIRDYRGGYWVASNITDADISGFEISHILNLKNGGIRSSFERIFAVRKENYPESKYGLRFPDTLLKISFFYTLKGEIVFSSLYSYKRIFINSVKGHFLNASLSIPVFKYRIVFHADNLFNTVIEEIPGIKIPGRWIYVSFSL